MKTNEMTDLLPALRALEKDVMSPQRPAAVLGPEALHGEVICSFFSSPRGERNHTDPMESYQRVLSLPSFLFRSDARRGLHLAKAKQIHRRLAESQVWNGA